MIRVMEVYGETKVVMSMDELDEMLIEAHTAGINEVYKALNMWKGGHELSVKERMENIRKAVR